MDINDTCRFFLMHGGCFGSVAHALRSGSFLLFFSSTDGWGFVFLFGLHTPTIPQSARARAHARKKAQCEQQARQTVLKQAHEKRDQRKAACSPLHSRAEWCRRSKNRKGRLGMVRFFLHLFVHSLHARADLPVFLFCLGLVDSLLYGFIDGNTVAFWFFGWT